MKKNLPLSDLTVIDFSLIASGPYCATAFADLGARVIRVESLSGDELRKSGPPFPNGEGTYFLGVNRNKECISIDLTKPEGQKVAHELVAKADIVVENFTPSVPAKLGIDYPTLKKVNPNIIYVAISGYGDSGPYRDRPGLDLVFQGLSGMMSLSGEKDGRPMRSPAAVVDMSTAIYAAYAALAALRNVDKGHGGERIEVSMLDVSVAMQAMQYSFFFGNDSKNIPRKANQSYTTVTDCFKTKDGYINVSIGFQKHWVFFCKAVGLNEVLENPEYQTPEQRQPYQDQLGQIISDKMQSQTTDEWLAVLGEAHVPCGAVLTYEQVLEDPQIQHDDIWLDLPHKRGGTIRSIALPVKFAGFEKAKDRAAPLLGEDTQPVLAELGYTAEQIESMLKERVVLAAKE